MKSGYSYRLITTAVSEGKCTLEANYYQKVVCYHGIKTNKVE